MNKYKKHFVRQHDQFDCGTACLSTIIKFYGFEIETEELRKLSGTSITGTTLLGLNEAANGLGLKSEGYEGNIEELKKIKQPAILHLLIDNQLLHYVVCFGYKNEKFIISDPARGITEMSSEELDELWKSKRLLLFECSLETLHKESGFHTGENIDLLKKSAKKNQYFFNILEVFKDDLNILFTSLVLGIFVAALGLSTIIFSQKLVDEILPNSNTKKLIFGIILLGLILLLKTGLSYLRQYFFIIQAKEFNERIINKFYSKLLYLPKTFFDSRKTGDLISRMNDTTRIQFTLTHLFGSVLIDLFLVILFSSFIFYYSLSLGIVTAIFVILFVLIATIYSKKIIGSNQEVMKSYANNEANYIDTIQGINEVKANNLEEFFTEITKKTYHTFQNNLYNLGLLKTKLSLIFNFFGSALTIALLGWGAFMVLNNEIQLGVLVALSQLVLLIVPSIVQLVLANFQFQEAKVAFERMTEITSIAPEYTLAEDDQMNKVETIEKLEVENLTFGFPGRTVLLKDVSFRAAKGEMVAILGESGSGKTTLIQIFQKFYQPKGGKIYVNGQDWMSLSTKALREKIAVVPQEVKIFNGTLLSNIILNSSGINIEEVINLCKRFNLDQYFEKLPDNYSTIVGEIGINLSGGQKQLVGFVRALIKKPQLLILDEATSSMDVDMEQHMFNILQEIKADISIIFITHQSYLAKKGDKTYRIEKSSMSETKEMSSLKTKTLI